MTFAIPAAQGTALLLVLLRTAGFVVTAPILGHRSVPMLVKAGITAVLAVNLAGHVAVAQSPLDFLIAAPLELAIGLALGFLLSLGFQAVEIIGRLIALQTGLSMGQAINPADESTATTIDPLFSVLAGLTFLAMNLHVAIVQALDHSFVPFPLGSGMAPGFIVFGAQLTALALELGTRIALPLALALLMVQVVIALLARAIPQINVFILGAPITLLAGIVLTAAAMPVLVDGAGAIFTTILRAVATGSIQ
jgi:flagellar biosynthetic protein FliR